MSGFFSLPMTAGARDFQVGEDDAGNPVYLTPRGDRYTVQRQAPVSGSRVKAGLEALREASKTPLESLGNVASALAQGAWQGVSAPGRAASGEPVTYGDVAATAMDWAAPAAAMRAPEGALRAGPIRAYHGSPHDFDKFSMDKIGTGEGAQAYGHGLYFAEAEDVAKEYKKSLAQRVDVDGNTILANNRRVGTTGDPDIDDALVAHNGDLEAAIADETAFADEMEAAGKTSRRFGGDPRTLQRKLEALRGKVVSDNSGRMYEVNINADPADFLDWDAPLSEQSQKIKDIAGISASDEIRMQEVIDEMDALSKDRLPSNRMRDEKKWFALANERDSLAEKVRAGSRGGRLYDYLSSPSRSGQVGLVAEHNGRVTASDELRNAGIPGIKYYDAGSRAGGNGTRNYVVFDDSLIDIIRKYGIAGALPLGAILGGQDDKAATRAFLERFPQG